MILLPKVWIKHMQQLPESGMGYHKVQVYVKGNRVFDRIIFNCELLNKALPVNANDIIDIR